MHRLQELVRLHRLGRGARETARLLGMGPNTERQYREALDRAGLLKGGVVELPPLERLREAVIAHAPPKPAPQTISSVSLWRSDIEELLDKGLGPQAVLDRLRQRDDTFKGSIGAVKRLVKRIRVERGVQADDVVIPVETDPGDVAQVDFGYAGRLYDPVRAKPRRAWVFVMVLGHSRKMFARLVFDQTSETWQRLHMEAFDELGGVPRTLVPDNLKAAVIRAAFGEQDDRSLNRSYVELARHYGFVVDPTPPRSPEKKGKVEAGVRYVKCNFLVGREGEDIDEVNGALSRWVREVADARTHGTTRRVPAVVFMEEEAPALLALPERRFELVTWKRTSVHADSHVHFDRRLYSVPWRLVGQKVWARATEKTVTLHTDDEERVATHARTGLSYRSTCDAHLPSIRVAYRHRNPDYWMDRADTIGEQAGSLVRAVFGEQRALSKLRMVQRLVIHLEAHTATRANAACRRALHFGNLTFLAVKRILDKGLDMDPLPGDRAKPSFGAWVSPPRFARDLSQLVTSPGGEA